MLEVKEDKVPGRDLEGAYAVGAYRHVVGDSVMRVQMVYRASLEGGEGSDSRSKDSRGR